MKKYIVLMILILMITGCKSKMDDSIYSTKEETEVVEVEGSNSNGIEQDYIEEVIEDKVLMINTDVLYVRSSFGLESTIISEVYQNQIFNFYDTKEDSKGSVWYKISADNDEWITGSYCSILYIDSIVGIYEYEYPYNTEDNNENHTLIFEIADNYLVGRYYGTTDDFDPAREGYYVGYYVTKLLNLKFEDNEISFELNPVTSSMFTEKIPLDIINTQEAVDAGFVNWQPGSNITEPMNYSGYFDENTITLETLYGLRELKKVIGSGQ